MNNVNSIVSAACQIISVKDVQKILFRMWMFDRR